MLGKVSATLVVIGVLASPVAAATVVNGSFEADGQVSDSPTLTGWTVETGNVDTRPSLSGGSAATDGTFLLDLAGNTAGKITQTLTNLIVGRAYTFSFDLGANNSSTSVLLELSGATTLSESVSANTGPLVSVSRDFFATDSALTFSFTDEGTGNSGPALDNVALSSVPAPLSGLLLGSAVLLATRLKGRRS